MTMIKGKLTAEFLKSHNVNFKPKSAKEVEFLQRRFFAMGIKWASEGDKVVRNIDRCLQDGLNVDNGRLYYGNDTNKTYYTATAAHLSKELPREYWTVEDRVDHLEKKVDGLTERLDRILAILEPKQLQKPPLVARKAGRKP